MLFPSCLAQMCEFVIINVSVAVAHNLLCLNIGLLPPLHVKFSAHLSFFVIFYDKGNFLTFLPISIECFCLSSLYYILSVHTFVSTLSSAQYIWLVIYVGVHMLAKNVSFKEWILYCNILMQWQNLFLFFNQLFMFIKLYFVIFQFWIRETCTV